MYEVKVLDKVVQQLIAAAPFRVSDVYEGQMVSLWWRSTCVGVYTIVRGVARVHTCVYVWCFKQLYSVNHIGGKQVL